MSVANWHPNEDHFGGKLAATQRPFRWRIGTQMKTISTAIWHSKKDHFGGELLVAYSPRFGHDFKTEWCLVMFL